MSFKRIYNTALVCISPVSEPWELAEDSGPKRTYRKELIYPGHFVKMREGLNEPELEFDITETSIDHWVSVHQQMMANGIDVPLCETHSTRPSDRRGDVVRLSKEFNPRRGTNSLYMYATFVDEDAEKLARSTNVSLFAPPEYTDGRGKRYERPIRHVALTDYPVIPGLDGFEPIAASYDDGDEFDDVELTDTYALQLGDDEMNLAQVAKKLGVKCNDDDNPIDMANAVIRWSNRRERRLAQLEQAMAEDEDKDKDELEDEEFANTDEDDDKLEDEDEELSNKDDEDEDEELAYDEDEDEDEELSNKDDEDEDDEDVEFSFDHLAPEARRRQRRKRKSLSLSSDSKTEGSRVAKSMKKFRMLQLSELVKTGSVSPAVAKRLAKRFCSGEALILSASDDYDDGFDQLIVDLSGNRPVSLSERTGPQVARRDGENNPLLADAERRRKDAGY